MKIRNSLKKMLIFSFVIITILTTVGCGNNSSSKTWTKDEIISAFEDKGIKVENITDAKDGMGAGAISEAVSFTSGDLGGSIIIMDNSKDLDDTAKQLENSHSNSIKYILNGNALITIISTSGAELKEEDYKAFQDALK